MILVFIAWIVTAIVLYTSGRSDQKMVEASQEFVLRGVCRVSQVATQTASPSSDETRTIFDVRIERMEQLATNEYLQVGVSYGAVNLGSLANV